MNEVDYPINDQRPFEIIDGQIYMMSSPKYNHVVTNGNLHSIFDRQLEGKRCTPFMQFNVFFDEDNHFIPDEVIVCNPEIIDDDAIHGAPDLVVEILSKSTARKDKVEKFFTYEKFGLKEYWIIDPFMKLVDVYHLIDEKLVRDKFTYTIYTDTEWKLLNEEERAEYRSEIKISLYDNFVVELKDIFKRVK